MRILVLSNTPWANDNSFGNSFTNIFSGIPDLEFANIYCRYGKVDSELVSESFQITEKQLVKNLKNKSVPSGAVIPVHTDSNAAQTEKPAGFEVGQKKRWMLMFWARDLIWKIGRWCSPELKAFVDDFKPDLIFQPIYYSNYLTRIALFLKKYTGVPMVGYISDDCYTLRQFSLSPLYWLDRLHKRRKVKKVFESCEFVYVISEIQRKEYEQIFSKKCKVLTKCADFSQPPELKEKLNEPLKIVYTGNLGPGRWQSVSYIAKALKNINRETVKAQMYLYSATPLTEKQKAALADGKNSFLMGAVPSSKIEAIQKDADILVHAEGMNLKSRLQVHQSFSTKIVDYLKNARAVFAVGPSDAASIDYFINNASAITATNEAEVEEKLRCYTDKPENIKLYAEKAYECGKKNHSSKIMKKMVNDDLKELVGR